VSAASNLSVARPATLFAAEKMIEQLQQKLQISELRVLVLEERLRLRRIEKYGAGSEKLSNLQLEMLEQEPGVSQAEIQAEQRFRKVPSTHRVRRGFDSGCGRQGSWSELECSRDGDCA
jgi:hypothetical protein